MTSSDHASLWIRRLSTALALCASAALSACSEDAPVGGRSAEVDAIAAYEALSAQLGSCEEEHAQCIAGAGNDATNIANCDAEEVRCKEATEDADDQARDALDRTTHRCQRDDDDDAGVVAQDDAGADGDGKGHGRSCVERRVPNIPKCVRTLFACLDDAGFRERSASREEFVACVRGAHVCFREELAKWRDFRRGRNGRPGQGEGQDGHAADGGGGRGGLGGAGIGPIEQAGRGGFGGGGAGGAGAGGAGAGGSGGGGSAGEEECDWSKQHPFDRNRNGSGSESGDKRSRGHGNGGR